MDITFSLSWFVAIIGWCSSAEFDCPGVTFVSREEWNSSIPNGKRNLSTPVNFTFIQHTAGGECDTQEKCSYTMRGIQRFHIDDYKFDDIGYNFVIGGDGKVYVGRGWQLIGAHTKGYNEVSHGISFIGNFMDHVPNDAMVQAAKALIKCGVDKGYIQKKYGLYAHRDGACTLSPGDAFYKSFGDWNNWHAFGDIKVFC